VCTHAGILTGEDGMSAHGIEDLALTCALPGFTVVSPADAVETAQVIRAAAATPGPFYVRLSRAATPVVHGPDYRFTLGRADKVKEGHDLTIIATGVMVSVSLDAAELLAERGISARVLNLHTLKPVDQQAVIAAARDTGAIVTAEEHYIHGGLGSIIAQVVGQHCPAPVEMVALEGYAESGPAAELMVKYGLTPQRVAEAAQRAVGRKGR
jgi:transketolase